MKRNFLISIWMTLATTVLLGIGYPLAVTGLAQWLFPRQANGEIIQVHGKLLGSSLIGQPFSAAGYFHSRPSEAGPAGYDPDAAGGGASNLGPTNSALITRVNGDVRRLHAENPGAPIPVDLVTSSGSGLDPDITPAGAEFQVARVARERGMSEGDVRAAVARHTFGRQWGFLGETRVNVLELNLELDAMRPMNPR
ncbi:MAG: potassium-transporting ATPase subunit KdpC [Candidatus Acidiferrales bacterium]